MRVVTKNSPNQSARIHGQDSVRIIVCHTPEGSYASASQTIMSSAAEVSYHRLYKKDGTEATQFVPWSRKAWHAKAYNSLSDGLSIEGFARRFDLSDPGTKEFAKGVAERCRARGVKPQWTTDPGKGGFCRHGDLQSDRTDPTPDLTEWRRFVVMVQEYYNGKEAPWPIPVPQWFWAWAAWKLGDVQSERPKDAPRLIPPWAWRRLKALQSARKV